MFVNGGVHSGTFSSVCFLDFQGGFCLFLRLFQEAAFL